MPKEVLNPVADLAADMQSEVVYGAAKVSCNAMDSMVTTYKAEIT